jgi:hypothetical protein
MVSAADFPDCDHVTLGDALHAAGRWRIFRQREMSPGSVVVRKIAGQNSAQMLLTEHLSSAIILRMLDIPLRLSRQ